MIDVLFITRCTAYRETGGDPSVLEPLRLKLDTVEATMPYLRSLVKNNGDANAAQKMLANSRLTHRSLPTLTPFYLSGFLSRRGVSMIEIECLELEEKRCKEILDQGVRVVAICSTWMSGYFGVAEELRVAARKIKAMKPDIPIVAGGIAVHKSMAARRLLEKGEDGGCPKNELAKHFLLFDPKEDACFDALAVGISSEITLCRIAERMQKGRDFRDLPNLVVPEKHSYLFTEEKKETIDVDKEIVDWSNHEACVREYNALVRSGVGCPKRCGFCDFSGLFPVKLRTDDSLIEELKTLQAFPAPRRVFFTDDNLAVNRKRILSFARRMAKENLGLAWRGFMRVDVVDDEVADALAASGCHECFIGAESGDAEILSNMKKQLDPEQALRGIEALDQVGINTMNTFVIGFPGECDRSLANTIRFISSLPSGVRANAFHRYYLFRFEVPILSPIARSDQRKRFGLEGIGSFWKHNTMDADGAKAAVKEVFTKVTGPSHLYLELPPVDWSPADHRAVSEERDNVTRRYLKGESVDASSLFAKVKEADC